MTAMTEYRASVSDRVRDQVRRYEATDGVEGGTLEGRPVIILTHIGAKTGALRKTPVMRIPDQDAYLVVASAAGAPTHPGWYFNLLAHPDVTVQDGATHFTLRARELSGEEKQRAWAVAETYWPHFPQYRQSAAGREIPILRLETTPPPNVSKTGHPDCL